MMYSLNEEIASPSLAMTGTGLTIISKNMTSVIKALNDRLLVPSCRAEI
jgi:hypothetical protein